MEAVSLHPKVKAGGTAGAFTILLVYLAGVAGWNIPGEVASAITLLVGNAAAYWRPSA